MVIERNSVLLVSSVTFLFCIFIIYGISQDIFERNRMRGDEDKYHFPTIIHFYEGGSISDYPAAMSPGYHLLSSFIYRISNGSKLAIRLTNSFITTLLVGLISYIFSASTSYIGALMALPAAFSLYIIPPGAWLLPDNLSWLLVLSTLFILSRCSFSFATVVFLSLLSLLSVYTRQTNVWLLAPISSMFFYEEGFSLNRPKVFIKYIMLVTPSLVTLLYLVYVWKGIVPPSFSGEHLHVSLSVIPFFVSLYFIYYIVYVFPYFLEDKKLKLGSVKRFFNWGLFVGLTTAIIIESDYSPNAGRVSGMWNLAGIFPNMYNRSVFIVFLTSLGGSVLYDTILNLRNKYSFLILSIFVPFVFVHLFNQYVYHRYFTGILFILFSLTILGLRDSSDKNSELSFYHSLTVIPFALFNLLVTIVKIF